MQSGSLTHNHSTVFYRYGGQGSIPLVCFHGYGETAAHFDFLEKQLSDRFFILAIDLPFHGQTVWNSRYVYPSDIADFILKILEALRIAAEDIHLLGFSMGGRLALSILPEWPDKIAKLVLLAPDGLKVNFWYWLATQSTPGNRFFRLTMSKPGWFMGMLRVSHKMGLINQSIFKFVQYYIHDEAVRKALYQRWTGFSRCRPDAEKIKSVFSKHPITFRVLYGKYDRIITPQTGKKFLDDVPGCKIEMVECGHQILHEKNAAHIVMAVLD